MIVTGWATGQEILNSPKVKRVQYRPDDPIHFIEQPNLRKIDELFNRLRIINNF